jgi:hypothetical protein
MEKLLDSNGTHTRYMNLAQKSLDNMTIEVLIKSDYISNFSFHLHADGRRGEWGRAAVLLLDVLQLQHPALLQGGVHQVSISRISSSAEKFYGQFFSLG